MICGASNALRSTKDRQPSDEAQSFSRVDMYEQISFFKGNQKEHIMQLEYLNETYKDSNDDGE